MQETARCNLQVAVTHHGDVLEAQPEPVATVPPERVCVCVYVYVCIHAGIVPVGQSCSFGGSDAERPRLGLLCSTEGIPRSSGAERPGALIPPSRLLLKIGLLLPLHPRL